MIFNFYPDNVKYVIIFSSHQEEPMVNITWQPSVVEFLCPVRKCSTKVEMLANERGSLHHDLFSHPELSLFPLSHRSGASDHTENGDSGLHASPHPGDAGELWGTGGPWSRGRERRKRHRSRQRRGRNRARELSSKSVIQIGALSRPEPRALLPFFSLSLQLKVYTQQLRSTWRHPAPGRKAPTQQTESRKTLPPYNKWSGGQKFWLCEPINSGLLVTCFARNTY